MLLDSTSQLIVPFAQCSSDGWPQVVTALKLKNLGPLLRGMKVVVEDTGQADSLSPPHERALASALGLTTRTDGLIPWAAHEARAKPGQAWAIITPCHWAMGREHATLTDPAALNLTEADSRTLLRDMQPYFVTEGITLHYSQPTRWLAEGDVFRNLPTASLDRVLGRNVDQWLPASKAIKLLQNEMQMLLYNHSVNDLRASTGQRPVNSFWLSGSGALTDIAPASPQVHVAKSLAQAALADNWAAYADAWAQLDADDIARLLTRQNSGQSVRLSLCGERNAVTFASAQVGIFAKIKNALSPQPLTDMLNTL